MREEPKKIVCADDEPRSEQLTQFVCAPPRCKEGEHQMDGPVKQIGERAYSVTCSKCGVSAFEVDTFMGGW